MKNHFIALLSMISLFLSLSILGCSSKEPASEPTSASASTPMPTMQVQRSTSLYNYSRLALKDLDEMNKLVQDKIEESRSTEGDKILPLREAMQAVYARPNDDFMIDKVVSKLRNELDEHEAWSATYASLVEESVEALQKPGKLKAPAQVTYAIMLENFIAEMKPNAGEKFEQDLLTKIKNAKITVTKKAINERTGMMRAAKSPSEIADAILKENKSKK